MTQKHTPLPINKLIWLSDLHLDRATDLAKRQILDKLAGVEYDAVLITGDISNSKDLLRHLGQISAACFPRPVYFVLGNHDYFDGNFAAVNRAVKKLCACSQNLIPLGHGEIVRLSRNTALIGTNGWYDGQSGAGANTWVDTPDRHRVDDFQGLSKTEFFNKLRDLGKESAAYLRRVLPLALGKYHNVVVATHVPPFTQAIRHNGTYCDWNRQPYFVNRSAGNVLMGISSRFTHRKIMVCAGHSHSPATISMLPNLRIRVGGAQPSIPAVQDILSIP